MPIPEIFLTEEEMVSLLQGRNPANVLESLETVQARIREKLQSIGVPVVEEHHPDVPAFGWFEADPQTGAGLRVVVNLAQLPKTTISPKGTVYSLPGMIGAILTHEMFHAARGHARMRVQAREAYAGTPYETYADKAAEFAGELAVRTGYPAMHAAFGLAMQELGEGLQPMYNYPAIAQQLGLPTQPEVGPTFEKDVFYALMANPEAINEPQQGQQGQQERQQGRQGQQSQISGQGQDQQGQTSEEGQQGEGSEKQQNAPHSGLLSEDVAERIQAIGTYIEGVLQADEEIRKRLEELGGEFPQLPQRPQTSSRAAGRGIGTINPPTYAPVEEEPWRVELLTALTASLRRKQGETTKKLGWKPRMSGAIIVPGVGDEEMPIVEGRPHIRLSSQGEALVPVAPAHILTLNPHVRPPLLVTLDTSGSMWHDIDKALATIGSFASQHRVPIIVNAGGALGAVVAFPASRLPSPQIIRERLTQAGADWYGGTDLLAVIAPLARYVQSKQIQPLGYVMITDTQSFTPVPPETLVHLHVQPQDAVIIVPGYEIADWAKQWGKQGARLIQV